jgi:hypothetical protein
MSCNEIQTTIELAQSFSNSMATARPWNRNGPGMRARGVA